MRVQLITNGQRKGGGDGVGGRVVKEGWRNSKGAGGSKGPGPYCALFEAGHMGWGGM